MIFYNLTILIQKLMSYVIRVVHPIVNIIFMFFFNQKSKHFCSKPANFYIFKSLAHSPLTLPTTINCNGNIISPATNLETHLVLQLLRFIILPYCKLLVMAWYNLIEGKMYKEFKKARGARLLPVPKKLCPCLSWPSNEF